MCQCKSFMHALACASKLWLRAQIVHVALDGRVLRECKRTRANFSD